MWTASDRRDLYDSLLHSHILNAVRGVEEEAGDALELVERAVFAIIERHHLEY